MFKSLSGARDLRLRTYLVFMSNALGANKSLLKFQPSIQYKGCLYQKIGEIAANSKSFSNSACLYVNMKVKS